MSIPRRPDASLLLLAVLLAHVPALGGCGTETPEGVVVTLPGSAVGDEARVLRRQLDRFRALHPDIRVVQRRTPDAADQRHQLYVQWLNAWADDPDILQLDVIWTPEFAAAGWILPLDRFAPDTSDFFPATLAANTWEGELYALPWFVDVGMLYWRTDLLDAPPASLAELLREAERAGERGASGASPSPASPSGRVPADLIPTYGWVLQAARYEGLVTVFVELLAAYGGAILDEDGQVVVDAPEAVRALQALHDAIESGAVPRAALTWHEEETRFAFQNGLALFMRNWPYAYPLMSRPKESKVAGRFAVSPVPAAPGGRESAALGGSQLAINARSDHPEAAWEVIAFLTHPDRMRERARAVGQYPPRPSLYADASLTDALPIPPARVRSIIERAVPRPATPLYTQLSGLLQIRLHRALSGQQAPADALADAAREMRALLRRVAPAAGGDAA